METRFHTCLSKNKKQKIKTIIEYSVKSCFLNKKNQTSGGLPERSLIKTETINNAKKI